EALREFEPVPGLPRDMTVLKALATSGDPQPAPSPNPTLAEVAGECRGQDWAGLVSERISAWAARYFDQGQSSWRAPWQQSSPYVAWRSEAELDRVPELMGVPGFRAIVKGLPGGAVEAALEAIRVLDVPRAGLEAYLLRLLMSNQGWAAFARYRGWESELRGRQDETLIELLAVWLSWERVLWEAFAGPDLHRAWTRARERFARQPTQAEQLALAVDLVLQSAYEKAWQRETLGRFPAAGRQQAAERQAVQAAFCIDVRSEIIRRALESGNDQVETLGFAGFFGLPIEYLQLGHHHGGAQCPVLLQPRFIIRETVQGTDSAEEGRILERRLLRRRVSKAWKSFKLAAVASFGFVETLGLSFGLKLATDSLGLTRTVTHPTTDSLDPGVEARLGPALDQRLVAGRRTGLSLEDRLTMAEAILKAMSFTDNFARLVLLVGHGSTTVNNPHATGLDCGACGGHTGEANARVAAAILNDSRVRGPLVERGITIPDDTVFIGALHDTATDEIALFDLEQVPASHGDDLAWLRRRLAAAARQARLERAALFNLEATDPDGRERAVLARSRDWSQVRPEWGLAGCAGFIAAPRHRTRGLDLAGRSFLHSYDWHRDPGFKTLELIMTAPMVVAGWISLQYYGSAVDNRVFGSGNKTLHNVVGTFGVLEGSGGDLRVGLPWQSVHDGQRLIHEPMRLSVIIEAPVEAINAIIARHDSVGRLLDNGWL
ncbi:MAG: DUF2309 domain-containing protein, partial [Candidatus Competibacteraceae bacterium]|nr:DUF2309 domain-containing protein [Candidatus Competibacteraceae bacterium]